MDKGREAAKCWAGSGMVGHVSIREEVVLLSGPQGGWSGRWAVCSHGGCPVCARSPLRWGLDEMCPLSGFP